LREDSSTVGWNQISREWCDLIKTNNPNDPGYFIMPYTLKQLGDVLGKRILDIGCGEGRYSRELAKRGADVTAVDCAEFSINCAKKKAQEKGLNIKHYIRNSNDLYDIKSSRFDIVLCSMMLMDCEDLNGTINEITRVLRPSGMLFVSVLHPCFSGKNIGRQDEGIICLN
jgi:2-polyprenyl-3-methyl-5-hydroxy-6-metoxy-1,4-benzoquinol methylase